MRQLDYAQDNRLRLWFLGVSDHTGLDNVISPRKSTFLKLIKKCLEKWKTLLKVMVIAYSYSAMPGANCGKRICPI